jgi:hypothetical protein
MCSKGAFLFMDSDYLFILLFYGAAAALIIRRIRKKRRNLSPKQIMQYLDSIDDLHETAVKYRTIENMIINLNTTDSRHLKNITLDVPTLFDGAGEKYNFLCSGGTSTKQFKKIAEQERTKLLNELFEKSEQLHKHHITALTKKRWGEDPEEETGET